MFCSSCGVKNDSNSKFCSSCGKPMGEASPQQSAAQSATPASVNKCPACRAPIESFQTRCSSCGSELGSAQSGESVASFFKKLDDLTQKEYEADKQRERDTGKKKQRQSLPLKVCEFIAVLSFILLVLHLTGINKTILSFFEEERVPYSVVISNNSPYDQDQHITFSVMVKNSSGLLQEVKRGSIAKGASPVRVRLEEGNEFLVLVRDGVNDEFYFPHQINPETTESMIQNKSFRLRFNGDALAGTQIE